MEVFIYSGFLELPSIDFDCLRVITYIKIFEIPVTIKTSGNPFLSPNAFLPYLQCNNDKQLIGGYEKIIEYFKQQGYGTMSNQEEFKTSAYNCYLNQKLFPCLLYLLWGDPVNVDTTRTLYAKRTPFPLNFIYPQKYMKFTEELIQTVANFNISEKIEMHNNTELLIKAKMCINTLSEKLGTSDWFLGKTPSEFDCSVYASLAVLLHIPLQNNDLKSHINECPNLLKFLNRIRNKYLLDIKVEMEQKAMFDNVKKIFLNKDNQTLSNTTIKIIAGLVAVSSMAFFAFTHGMVEIGSDSDDDNNGYAYESTYGADDLGED